MGDFQILKFDSVEDAREYSKKIGGGKVNSYKFFKIKTIKDVDLGYLAGMIDGEGSFRIDKIDRRRAKIYDYYVGISYEPTVRVYNGNRGCLERLKNIVGGGKILSREPRGRNHSKSYWFIMSPNILRQILPVLKDYLTIKKDHCELVIKFLSLTKNKNDKNYKRTRILEVMRLELKNMNLKGKNGKHTIGSKLDSKRNSGYSSNDKENGSKDKIRIPEVICN